MRRSGWLRAKRCADLGLATVLLVALSIPIAAIALVVRLRLGRPILFRQLRPGKDGRLFELLKFRTMVVGRETAQLGEMDEARTTDVGHVLRRWSLDELPELVNVVAGDMSLVGPRPLLPEYLDRYDTRQMRRHEMRPGLTGWAQVNGRNDIDWAERLEMDVWYVDNWSLGLDFKILYLTIGQVLKRQGISASGHATMPEFRGKPGTQDE